MVVLATTIDIGSPAIDRSSTRSAGITVIDQNNPANASGTITKIEIWADTVLVNCEVATFYNVGGTNFTTRDTHFIGNVASGLKQTYSGLDITVQAGDYIGIIFTAGTLELDLTGEGYWYYMGDAIPCSDVTFTASANRTMSLYGIGETPGITWNGVTISKWNTKEFTKWNGLE